MATATTPARGFEQSEPQRRVHHPLERLRGYIRFYVGIEGLAVLLIYAALWFWIGLLLDYGFFKLFTVDWVQELPWAFRVVVLMGLVAGMMAVVAMKVLARILREFRPPALALVIERRFPQLLGDRLITAVEMADPRLAKRYGFSQAMIDKTVRDAAERVEQAPVQEVFNWKRLHKLGWAVAGLTVGLFVVVGVVACAISWAKTEKAGVNTYVAEFGDVASIWFERNILLSNTIWPRRAHLELVGFPESGELRIGRNVASAPIRVRALKWVIADKHAPEGWRALAWSDLTPDLLGAPVPAVSFPADWQSRDPARGLTVDEVELQLEKPDVKGQLPAELLLAVEDVRSRLKVRAEMPAMSRKLRMLNVPITLDVYYKGATISSEMRLQKGAENEYSGTFTDLKESVTFTVRGEDYYILPRRRITVVPPPMLVELVRDESQPAYIYHRRPAGGQLGDLKGLKQEFSNIPVSLAGEASHIDVPVGSDVRLTARSDKELVKVSILPRKGKGKEDEKEKSEQWPVPALDADKHTFRCAFTNLSGARDFDFEFTDTDNVVGRRHMLIRSNEDIGPDVNVEVGVVRRTGQGFMITPIAMIPFSGAIRDDHGLHDVGYAYSLVRLESAGSEQGRAVLAASIALLPGGRLWNAIVTARLLPLVGPAEAQNEKASVQRLPMGTFEQEMRARSAGEVSMDVLHRRLANGPPQSQLLKDEPLEVKRDSPWLDWANWRQPLKELRLEPDTEYFDLQRDLSQLKVSDDNQVQPRYRMRLWMTAVDNNVETGPRKADSKEQFTFIIVAETELLAEIAKEEEALHLKMEDTFTRIKDAKVKLEQIARDLAGSPKEVNHSTLAIRAQEIEETIVKGGDVSREVLNDYNRILKELKVNRVQTGIISRVDDGICKPLDLAVSSDFVRAEEAVRELRTGLEGKKSDDATTKAAEQRVDELLARLQKVIDGMGEIIGINKLIVMLQKIEEGQRKNVELFNDLERKIRDKIMDDLRGLEKPEEPKKKPSN